MAIPHNHERQLSRVPTNHILTNSGCWLHDSQWIVYDVRSDPAGTVFDSPRIERIHVPTGRVEILHQAQRDAQVGVVTASPVDNRVVFIQGPEQPTRDWSYSATHRRGVVLNLHQKPLRCKPLDARQLVAPFTPGALRGGTHLHTFSGDGQWISCTYHDALLAQFDAAPGSPPHDPDQRNIAVSLPEPGPVLVPRTHPRNHSGTHWSVLVTRTVADPTPGSDEISRAYSDAWIGIDGYHRQDGTHQRRAIAYQGDVRTADGQTIAEAFMVDLPSDPRAMTRGGIELLAGTLTTRPAVPPAITSRRLTFTSQHRYPGIAGPRHWLRSSPDGRLIALLKRDLQGVVQLWTVSPAGGELRQLTCNPTPIASAFSWSPDGRWLAHVMDGSVCITDAATCQTHRLTTPQPACFAPSPLACVFAPNGQQIAYLRPQQQANGRVSNQIFVISTSRKAVARV